MLDIKNLTKSFGGVQAVRGSTFRIEEKKITALIGPNGAGKTTIFDMVSGLLKSDSGEIVFNRTVLNRLPAYARANLGVSRTFQQVRLFTYLTILDHLRMIEDNTDMQWWCEIFRSQRADRTKYQAMLDEFGIKRDLDTPVSDLSYGQRKLLDLAMALKRPHKLLMLDEPVAGVNSVIQEQIEQLLLRLKKAGETVFLIDHDMEFVRHLADHVIVLDAGVVLTEGAPEVVLRDPRVLEAYLGA